MKTWIHCIASLFIAILPSLADPVDDLQWMKQKFAESKAWDEWLEQTGEMPPDFDSMPGILYLPDPLKFQDGSNVSTSEKWSARREEILDLCKQYITGTYPPPPGNVRVESEEILTEPNGTVHKVVLAFGPDHQAKLHLELLVPNGDGPFPVFVTQDNHRRWASVAMSRGYIGCVYAGADSNDDTGAFVPIWKEYDWTKLTRRAWAASRCVDYLYTLPNVDKDRIAITGHSRNGKLSIIASAMDERFTAMISSSSGSGGSQSYRWCTETNFAEGIQIITTSFPDWLHPRLRFFAGRENKLPVDQNLLIACSAPRPVLFSTALNDNVEFVWDLENVYRSVKSVYDLLGVENKVHRRYRSGNHETRAEDIEAFVDWLDCVFANKPYESSKTIYPTHEEWQQSGNKISPMKFPEHTSFSLHVSSLDDWAVKKEKTLDNVQLIMGSPPPHVSSPAGSYGSEVNYKSTQLGRNTISGIEKVSVNFGNYIAGDLYFKEGTDQTDSKLPAIIWLHPVSNSNGYVAAYRRTERPHLQMAKQGYAVFAFDQIGNGNRLEEVRDFYTRYPQWSLLGKTVTDIRDAVDALREVPFIDSGKIYLVGYDAGAAAGLHAAALDKRIAGVVSIAGFTPMRTNTVVNETGGIGRLSTWYPFHPRLGSFVGNESRIPYDYHELIAAVAPRPVIVVRPKVDFLSVRDDVLACIESAKTIYQLYGKDDQLVFHEVDDYNRLSQQVQDETYERMGELFLR